VGARGSHWRPSTLLMWASERRSNQEGGRGPFDLAVSPWIAAVWIMSEKKARDCQISARAFALQEGTPRQLRRDYGLRVS
jgi:hypothetical protein